MNCGEEVDDKAVVCVHCGVMPWGGESFCQNCGSATAPSRDVCRHCGVTLGNRAARSRIVAGVFALLLGVFGAHKFYLGYYAEAIIILVALLAGAVTGGLSSATIFLITIVEGVIYLLKTEEDFQYTYVLKKKGWF
jgi:TM2 domain-containing membrane protein YozV